MIDRKAAVLLSLGFEIIGIVLASVYFGNYLDTKFGWGGLGLVGMIILGFAGWLFHLLTIVKDLDKDSKNGPPDQPSGPS